MISHREAEALISARLDQQLDPLTERELNAHLATCPQCRAFARSSSALASGLRQLPYLPPSPTVSRAVNARIEQGRSPWMRIRALVGIDVVPALSTLAIVALVLVLGFLVLNRLSLDQGPLREDQQLASQPTVQPETPALLVSTPEATETPAPTETAAPTATTAPTETAAPTATAAPTETVAPEPTATTPPEPTATSAPEPTATVPTGRGSAGEATSPPVDLTAATEESPEAEPSSTPSPSPEPTEEPEPTATTAPEPTPTKAEPTPTPTEEPAPPIVPIDGGEVVQAPEDAQATEAAGETPEETEPSIQSIETPEAGEGGSGQAIEPISGDGTAGTPARPGETPQAQEEQTPESTATEVADEQVLDLEAHSESYGGIAGDPSGRLVLDDGRMEYQPMAHGASLTSMSGIEASTVDTDGGQAIALCIDGECTDVSSESASGPATDTPLGWIQGGLVYVRDAAGAISYHILVPDESGTSASDTAVYDGGGALRPTTPVYLADGRLWVITEGAGWLVISSETARLYEDGVADARLLRFVDTGDGALVGYVTGGTLVIASQDAPGTPIASVPFSGRDFDMSPGGARVAVSTDDAIEVYDLDGTLVSRYASPDIQPGTVLWLNSGIVYHDDASGILMQIPDPPT